MSGGPAPAGSMPGSGSPDRGGDARGAFGNVSAASTMPFFRIIFGNCTTQSLTPRSSCSRRPSRSSLRRSRPPCTRSTTRATRVSAPAPRRSRTDWRRCRRRLTAGGWAKRWKGSRSRVGRGTMMSLGRTAMLGGCTRTRRSDTHYCERGPEGVVSVSYFEYAITRRRAYGRRKEVMRWMLVPQALKRCDTIWTL